MGYEWGDPAAHVIEVSNARLRRAIVAVRIMGRNPETMGEVYDALNSRRNYRQQYLAAWHEYFTKLGARLQWENQCREMWRQQALLTNVTRRRMVTVVN